MLEEVFYTKKKKKGEGGGVQGDPRNNNNKERKTNNNNNQHGNTEGRDQMKGEKYNKTKGLPYLTEFFPLFGCPFAGTVHGFEIILVEKSSGVGLAPHMHTPAFR